MVRSVWPAAVECVQVCTCRGSLMNITKAYNTLDYIGYVAPDNIHPFRIIKDEIFLMTEIHRGPII
jgi:hypothetical protein